MSTTPGSSLGVGRDRWIYWGDRKMWSLSPSQRCALQFGRITPREARVLYDLNVLVARAFWRQVKRGEIAFPGQVSG